MNRLPDKVIEVFDRQYDLAFGRGDSGTWLMLVNRQTEAVLPLTTTEKRPTPIGEVHMWDVDRIVPALEEAGIVRRLDHGRYSLRGLAVRRCEIVHAGLLEQLRSCEAARKPSISERDEQARNGRER